MAEVVVSAVVNPVAENSVNTIGRQFGYLWNYKKNMSYLEKQVVELQSKINDTDRSVDAAERNAKEIGDQVKNWVSEAKGIIGQANKILEHKEKGKLRCRVGLCPNLVSRHRLGRKASKIVLEVADVITKVPIREVFFRPVGQERTILSTKGLFAFDSRKSIFDEIMKALQTEPMVGLYGFGGMGKTTLAKQVAKRAEEEMLFEEFVFASVTQKVDMKEIQGQLASMLGLNLVESTVAERANRMHLRLKGKKVLVILDDLWDELNLEEVGVSFGAEYMGCKILLTSRFGRVLTSMGTGKIVNLGALDEEEAWRLFKDKDRDGVLKNSNFHDIGKEVAKRCQGLPVLIVTVAASLSKRPQLSAWNDALRQLKEMDNKQMHDIVNFAIESISYNHLKKTHKQLFLLCGIIGGDASIEEVLQYSWGLDLFDEESVTIQAARDRLHNLIFDLKESCLLLDNVDRKNSIKMHDVVRDVAISIGSKDLNMFSMKEHGVELNIWRKDDDLKRCTSMVLRGCPNIPPTLECPLLELFVMSGLSGDSSSSIPESFFEKTVKLKVLGMSRLSFSVLPPSLSFLTNLQTLRVNYCGSLKNISIVGELKKLQILSFASYTIDELPSGIGQLSELRSLDVRGCSGLKVIPAGLIQGLTRLEELYVTREFNRWEAEERVNGSVKTNASLRELKHLHNLCSLEVRVKDDKFLLEDIHFEKLERYEIIVGDFDNLWWLDKIEVTRKFCVQLSSTSINHLPQGFKRLFERAECLWLEELRGFKNVTPALDGDVSSNLKHLGIKKDYEIECVVNVEDNQRKTVFPYLESLHLDNLVKLQKICNFPPMKGSFCNLTTMRVSNCNGLESLFSFSMATGLPRLQVIEVSDCHALEAIVAEKSIKDDGGININDGVPEEIEFAQLRTLTLERLPKLKNFFCNGEMQNKSHKSQSPNLNTKDEEEELKSILPFFTKVSFPRLEKLKLHGISNFKYLLTFSVSMGLVGLKNLKVKDCVGMKHLVVADEEGETNIETLNFPQLRKLCLQKLPNLTAVYSLMGSNDTQPPISKKVLFPELVELEVSEISNLTEIWSHVFQEISCCNLTSLTIKACKSLKHVFPAHVAPSLNKLEYLFIRDCEEVETIICDENYEESQEIIKAAQHEHAAATFMFFKLNRLVLRRLPKVKCFYPRKHTIKCPVLTSFSMTDCGNLSIFDFLSFPPKEGDDQFEKVVSKFENLSIGSTELKMIRDLYGHFPPRLFSSLERLEIVGSDVFPSEFLGIIHKQLTDFTVNNCSFQEIFPYEGEFTNHANDHTLFFPQLACLQLYKLPELKYICKHDQKKSFMLNILGRLECIFVVECPLLTNLVQPSTTRCLEKLWCLTITGCEKMEKVIGDDDDELSRDDDNEIIFPSLLFLKLAKLPRLRSFCSSPNYTFNFPKLTYVSVRECPNMKTFCEGITTTPDLKEVNFCEGGEERCEGDLNTTIQKVFAETEAKRLGKSLPSTSSSNHVEGNAGVLELTELIPHNAIESSKGTETCEEVTEEEKDGDDGVKATAPGINDKGKGKEQMVAGGSVASSSKLSNHCEEVRELAPLLPSTSSTHYTEATNQVLENSAKPHNDATNADKMADTLEKGSLPSSEETNPPARLRLSLSLPTELEVRRSTPTVESEATNPRKVGETWNHSEIEIPVRTSNSTHSIPSLYTASSVASSLKISNPSQEAEIHDIAAEELSEPTIEVQICKHVVDELGNKTEIFEKSTFCDNVIELRNTKVAEGKEMEVQRLPSTVPITSSSNDIEAEAQVHVNLTEKVTDEPLSDFVQVADAYDKEPETSTASSSSHQESFRGLRESFQLLEAQPMSRVSAEQVRFMEEASEWFSGYVKQAREYLEQKELISELELKIDDMEAQLQALKEKKRVAEEKKKVASRVAKFG